MSSLEEATLFLDVLAHGARTPLDGVKIIVFEASEQIRPPRSFLANVAVVSRRDDHPAFIRRLRSLDVAPLLEESDFYHLDDHFRASGHARSSARPLAQALNSGSPRNHSTRLPRSNTTVSPGGLTSGTRYR